MTASLVSSSLSYLTPTVFSGDVLYQDVAYGPTQGIVRVGSDGTASTFAAVSAYAIAADDSYLYASIDNRIVAYRQDDAVTAIDIGRIDSAGYSFTILVTDDAYVYGFATSAVDRQEGAIFRFAKPAK